MAKMRLGEHEQRVVGCLVEKELTTPEYYPLSVNALTAACNQKSNRDPVLSLTETDVVRALESLRGAGLAYLSAEGGRVQRHAHNLIARINVDEAQVALLAELLLRGPQTAGELRARAERMHHFEGLAAVEESLEILMTREPPLVERMARQPGRKEPRYQHLLGDAPVRAAAPESAREGDHEEHDRPDREGDAQPHAARERSTTRAHSAEGCDEERIARLESEVMALRAEVKALWREMRSLTMQPDPDSDPDGSA